MTISFVTNILVLSTRKMFWAQTLTYHYPCTLYAQKDITYTTMGYLSHILHLYICTRRFVILRHHFIVTLSEQSKTARAFTFRLKNLIPLPVTHWSHYYTANFIEKLAKHPFFRKPQEHLVLEYDI